MDDTLERRGKTRVRSEASRFARLDIEDSLDRQARSEIKPPPIPRSVRSARVEPAPAASGGMFAIELHTLLDHLRRHLPLILAMVVVGVSAAVVYGFIAPPKYTVTTEILVDPANLQVVSDDLYNRNDQRDSLLLNVESRMRVLTSANVLSKVVADLNLGADKDFVPPPSFMSLFGSSSSQDDATTPELIALRTLTERVKASRDEKSFVVTLAVTTGNAAKSVAVSKAIYTAFQAELVRGEAEGAGRAANSLIERLAELKGKVTAAEQGVEDFRREHALQASQGELMSTQSLTQLNNQVVEAERAVFQAQSRYDDLNSGGEGDRETAAAQQSATLSALRTQYATLKQEADSLSGTLGPRHPRVQAVLPQVQALEGQIAAERARIVQAARSDLDQAVTVLSALKLQSSEAQSVVVADNSAEVTLRELQRDAQAQAAIYEAFLVRARQVTERETIDTTNVRVISEPVPPKERSWPPRTAQLLGLGATAGLALGALLALVLGLSRPQRRPFV